MKINGKRLAAVVLFSFVMVLALTVAAQAAGRNDVQKELKALKLALKQTQAELRRLNEEGGSQDQAKAQELMEKIRELRQKISDLEAQSPRKAK